MKTDFEAAMKAAIRAVDDGGQLENGVFRISDERIESVILDVLAAFRAHGWELQPIDPISQATTHR